VHVASTEAAKHSEQVNFADVGQGKEHIECKVSAAEAHKLDSAGEELLDNVQPAVGQDFVFLNID